MPSPAMEVLVPGHVCPYGALQIERQVLASARPLKRHTCFPSYKVSALTMEKS